jgi:lysophospholipase L1-like esterase
MNRISPKGKRGRHLHTLRRPAWALLASLLLFHESAEAGEFFVKDGDRVVFLGDSITEQGKPGETERGGLYTVYVEAYVLSRFPAWTVSFRNVGIGGDSAMLTQRQAGPIDREALKNGDDAFLQKKVEEYVALGLSRDVLPLKPTLVTVAFGMNDFGYHSFEERGFNRFIHAENELVKVLHANGSRVALFTTQALERQWNVPDSAEEMKNAALRKYADGLKTLAAQQGVAFVDRFDRYFALIQRVRAANPQGNLGGSTDPVHPGPSGHAIMAWCILKDLGATPDVSFAEIDASRQSVARSDKCKITNVTMAQDGSLTFRRADEALPMPIDPRAESALPLAPITEDLNRYLLKVTGLEAPRYEVYIDGELSETVAAAVLQEGWNLANAKGPITAQAQRLLALILKKNAEFFHRWREVQLDPARQAELARCDQRLADLEAELKEARQPSAHTFTLKPQVAQK